MSAVPRLLIHTCAVGISPPLSALVQTLRLPYPHHRSSKPSPPHALGKAPTLVSGTGGDNSEP